RQVESAIGLYKSKFQVPYLPAFGGGTGATFRLCSSYRDASGNFLPWPEVAYLKQVFPQMEQVQNTLSGVPFWDNGLRDPSTGGYILKGIVTNPTLPPGLAASPGPVLLDPNQLLVFFLTGSVFTGNQGFSNNKILPFQPSLVAGETRVGPFLDFPVSA